MWPPVLEESWILGLIDSSARKGGSFVLAAEPNALGLNPGSYVVEGENQFLQVFLWVPHVYIGNIYTYMHSYMHVNLYAHI